MHKILAKGLDVSSHQGLPDWKKVKAEGYTFVFIRLGFMGYSNGSLNVDKSFLHNMKGAKENGFDIGLYFYAVDKNVSEATKTAQFVIDTLKKNDMMGYVNLPIVYDMEGYGSTKYRNHGITKEERTKCVQAFNDVMKQNGFEVLLYGSQALLKNKFELTKVKDYLWVAKYYSSKTPNCDDSHFPTGYDDERIAYWQYASCGKVNGIEGAVDLDNMYINIMHKDDSVCPYREPSKDIAYSGLSGLKSSADVKWIQWMLNARGYNLVVDGKYGKKTYSAVQDFQNKHKITDCKCGCVGSITRNALKVVSA